MSYFKVKCTKFDFRWGSAPDPAVGAYNTPPYPLLYLMGLLLRAGERGEENREGRGSREGKGKRRGEGWHGKGGEGPTLPPTILA